jgi:hypothetical protein
MANTQLTHFFKNTFSKTSTLALSFLITFSFSAFAAESPQPFNKEAYLDLGKPYTHNWNNSQLTSFAIGIKLRYRLNGFDAVI